MLCACPSGRRWRWLASHHVPDSDELVLVEHQGAVPGDPDGELVAVSAGIARADVGSATREWLERRLRHVPRERRVSGVPAHVARGPVAWEPGDRRVDQTHAHATVAAAADGAATGFCVFGNPAAHRAQPPATTRREPPSC
jgi:hypothetical protein